MKKIITLIIGLCLCFALMGCGGSGSNSSEYTDPSSPNGEFGSAVARYENGNFIIPITTYPYRQPRVVNNYTVKSDKYTWDIQCSTGINIKVPSGRSLIRLNNKDGYVIVPEKYTDDFFIKTQCSYKFRNKKHFYDYNILITQNEN